MEHLIIKALNNAGYTCEPTEENLIDCFKEYVASGIWSNIQMADVDDFSVMEMCRALIIL